MGPHSINHRSIAILLYPRAYLSFVGRDQGSYVAVKCS